jgi:hypothetical protein
MQARQRRALKWSALALTLGFMTLLGRIWLDRHGAVERPELGVVGEFILRDHVDQPLTRDQLRRSLTVIIYWPPACSDANLCAEARTNINAVNGWIEHTLTAKWGEDHNPLMKLAVGSGAKTLSLKADWRRFESPQSEVGLLPVGSDLTKPWLVVVDNNLQFAFREDFNQVLDLSHLERVLSKTAFDQYLGNYLSKRTFMGPKRTQN